MDNCGIYKITNIVNNKCYVGSSINIKNRIYKHFWLLSNNKHYNLHLQKSYNKYGKSNFIYEVIELCSENELFIKENFNIEKFKSNDFEYGYNLATVNEFRRNNFNYEVKKKLSIHNKFKNKNFNTFSLTNIENGLTIIFDNLVDAANYLVENNYAKGKLRNVRAMLSVSLRGKKVDNGHKGSIRKTCYGHKFQIIN
jgi:group I intron endonuclease